MLAWPYGAPDVNSGYEFSDTDAGPARTEAGFDACWQSGWKCQHNWPEIKSMVAFRNATRGRRSPNWWDNGNDAIAFGRGGRASWPSNHEVRLPDPHLQTSLRGHVLQHPEHTPR
ncbi:hypothetical protein GCM10023238_26300 [Streptomyces heliomycini]